MAVFKRLTKEEINKDFTHYALFYGFVPVYVRVLGGEARIAVRNWVPEITLDCADIIFDFVTWTIQLIDPTHERLFFYHLKGEINGKNKNIKDNK